MIDPRRSTTSLPGLALALVVLLVTVGAAAQDATSDEPNPALLNPRLATETAPDEYRVKLETTAGDIVIRVVREWAPNGADRFYNLVKIGYYDNTAFFRVIQGFMAQVGIHGNPEVTAAWYTARIPDDTVRRSNTKGMVTFAMSSQPNSRTTQFFINFGNNSYLDTSRFAAFGKVVEGMDVVQELYSGYGEGAPRGKGPNQGRLMNEGNAYLEAEFDKLDYINRATILED
jgi:peptidyl-prolyl cis-trans isomerase A (cyclophilin A)